MTTPSGPNIGVEYTLTGPDGTVAVFNGSPSGPHYVGAVTEITGLDGAEVRQTAENLSGQDGGVHGLFLYGRRPIVLTGKIYNVASQTQRNERITRLLQASNAMRKDAILSWTPEGGEAQFVKVRRSQPPRVSGSWDKDFQLGLIAEDPRIYSVSLHEASGSTSNSVSSFTPASTPEYIASTPSYETPGSEAELAEAQSAYLLEGTEIEVVVYNTTTKKWASAQTITGAGVELKHAIVSLDRKNVYVIDHGESKLKVYTRNTATGHLTLLESVTMTGTGELLQIAESFNGTRIAVVGHGSGGTLSVFSRGAEGKLTGLSGSPLTLTGYTECNSLAFGYPGSSLSENMVWVGAASSSKGKLLGYQVGGSAITKYVEYTLPASSTAGPKHVVSYNAGLQLCGILAVCPEFGGSHGYACIFSTVETAAIPAEYRSIYLIKPEVPAVTPKFVGTPKERVFSGEPGPITTIIQNMGASFIITKFMAQFGTSLEEIQLPNLTTALIGPHLKQLGASQGYEFVLTEAGLLEETWSSPTSTNPKVSIKYGTPGATNLVLENKGDSTTFPLLRLEVGSGAAIEGPVFTNEITGQQLIFNLTMNAGDVLEVDMLNRLVLLNGENGYRFLENVRSEWWELGPGTTTVTLSLAAFPGTGTITFKSLNRSAWV